MFHKHKSPPRFYQKALTKLKSILRMLPDKYICFLKRNDIHNKEGKYAVRLRITKNRQRRYINLKLFADNDEWDTDNEIFIVQKNVRGEKQKKPMNSERKTMP